jgi:uncharacterized protein (TIGR02996 family)
MHHEDAFLQAIIANPEDPAPRLVYADWLEEQGQAERAEFARVQAMLRQTPASDPRHERLEARHAELLWVAHREGWVRLFGVAMTWENVLTLFRRWLYEAIAWWGLRRPLKSFWTPALEPGNLLGRGEASAGHWVWHAASERQAIVNTLANKRAELLAGGGWQPQMPYDDLAGGRLLLFDPDGTLSDGAAAAVSHGYLDEDNLPAWDT